MHPGPSRSFAAAVTWLRDAPWLTAGRARVYCRIVFAVSALAVAISIAMLDGGVDSQGRPFGTDFASFWTASQLALDGRPEAAYDSATHHTAQIELFGPAVPYYAFLYPPVFLLICLPFALLPYWAALIGWLGVTGAMYWRMAGSFAAGHVDKLAILAFPAVFLNVVHGQNAFLTASLFGAGVLWLDKRPLLAGVCFGCLVFKPQLAFVVPFALVAAGRWPPLITVGLTVPFLAALSYAVLGEAAWRAFFATADLTAATLEQGLVGYDKMQSVFSAVRLLHGPVWLAYALQACAALAALSVVVRLSRSRSPAEGAAMAAATFLISPFMLDYDLALLIIPLAWLAGQGITRGFMPWEKSLLLAAFILPAMARPLATAIHLPLTPLITALVLTLVATRAAELRNGLATAEIPSDGRRQ